MIVGLLGASLIFCVLCSFILIVSSPVLFIGEPDLTIVVAEQSIAVLSDDEFVKCSTLNLLLFKWRFLGGGCTVILLVRFEDELWLKLLLTIEMWLSKLLLKEDVDGLGDWLWFCRLEINLAAVLSVVSGFVQPLVSDA